MKFKNVRNAFVLGMMLLLTSLYVMGCATADRGTYQDANVYTRALYGEPLRKSVAYEGPLRNPVIVIHGLLGAKLTDSINSENIWGSFALAELVLGRKFQRLAHPMEYGVPLNALQGTVRPSGILGKSEIRVMGFEFEYEGYDMLLAALKECGYVSDEKPLPLNRNFYSLFVFAYDWRRDISENAVRLNAFIRERKDYLRRKYRELYGLKDYDVRFDVVAHSMGGLLARYYLRYGGKPLPEDETKTPKPDWAGAKDFSKIVIIATPNAGYADTLLELVNGLRLTRGAPLYPKTLVGTFVSYYQMLPDPEGKCVIYADDGTEVDYLNSEVWKKFGWGLADPKADAWLSFFLPGLKSPEERRKTALDHLEKCLRKARQFKKAMRSADRLPNENSVFLIAGDALETNRTLSVDRKTGALKVFRKDAGDGKITAASARLDLRDGGKWLPFSSSPIRWTGVWYLQGGHMGVMNSDVFRSNLRYILQCWPTESQRNHPDASRELLEKTGGAL